MRRALPSGFEDRISSAGASAHRWYLEHLLIYADPNEKRRRVDAVVVPAFMLALTGFVVSGHLLNASLGDLPVIAVLVVGVLVRRLRSLYWAASTVSLMVSLARIGHLGMVVSGVLVAAAAFLVRRGAREVLLAWIAAAAAYLAWSPLPVGAWAAAGVALAGAAVTLWLNRRGRSMPGRRVTPDHLRMNPGDVPMRLPLVVRLLAREDLRHVPKVIEKKKIGALGERRTAVVLLALPRGRGTLLAHDVLIPGADDANADHVVFAPSGVYVIDSKQFGTRDDPGVVRLRGSTLTHETQSGSRALSGSVRIVAWAAKGIGPALGHPAAAIIAVHGAQVEEGLAVTWDGVRVEVMPAAALYGRISGAPALLRAKDMFNAQLAMRRLRAASGGRVQVSSPVGSSVAAREALTSTATAQTAESAAEPMTVGPWAPAAAPEPTQPVPVQDAPTPAPAAPSGHVPAAPVTALQPTASAMRSLSAAVSERWEQMSNSVLIPPDEVPPELTGLTRGTPISIIGFSGGDMVTTEAVAMSGVCLGLTSDFVWVCAPQQYLIHCTQHIPVNVETVPVDAVFLANPAPQAMGEG